MIEFAEFLANKEVGDESASETIPEPVAIDRPSDETVISAIKRLTASYPMLDKDKLFGETSNLMMLHVMKGEDAEIVIDKLEIVFQEHYQKLVDTDNQ